jgi:hypothetical protein
MSSLIQMQAVMEAPHYEGEFSCPWETPKFQPFSMIRLHGKMTYQAIGLVIAQLAQYNQIELAGDKQTIFKELLEAESLILPGGIQVIDELQNTISPSCCCGLETWREWVDFPKTGETPWLGHDPSPFVENRDNVVRIWSDGGIDYSESKQVNAFYIDTSRDRFAKALILVEQDLQAFLFCIDSWAKEVGFAQSSKLSQKFDEYFNIKKNYASRILS